MFKRLKVLAGDVDPRLLAHGELGRAIVTGVSRTGVYAGAASYDEVCVFSLDVRLDNQPPFVATVRQHLATADVALMIPNQTIVAVRVDPADHSKVAIDLSVPPPVVTVPASGAVTVASILEAGAPVRAVIVNSGPLCVKNPAGVEIFALKLTILADGKTPAQFDVGNPVPTAALPLLYPGCNVPAKQMPQEPNDIAIDWAAALVEYSGSATHQSEH